MISKWIEAQIVRGLLDAVRLDPGEDVHAKLERIGAKVGVSGRTLYNYSDSEHKSRISLDMFLRLCVISGQGPADWALEEMCKYAGSTLRRPDGAGE